jgi:hypothetical protein
MKRLRPALLLMLIAMLAACDVGALAQKLADRVMSHDDKAVVADFFADTRAGHFDAARQHFSAGQQPPSAALAELRQMLICCGPPRLASFNARKIPDHPWRLDMVYRLGRGHDAHAVGFRIDGPAGQRHLSRFTFGHSADMGSAIRNALRWTGAAAALMMALTALVIWRRRRRRTS